MKRMFAPDDEDKPFIARWNMLIRILLVESSVKHIARAAMDYADFSDGSSCHPSNERLARESGYNERTVRFAWSVMRGLGMADRVSHGVAHRRLADEYELQIPEHWQSLPILGPHGRKFTCPGCDKLFNPNGNCSVNDEKADPRGGDAIRFDLTKLTFCPAPRKTEGRDGPACVELWNRKRKASSVKLWGQLGNDRWEVFRGARGDNW